MKAIILVGIINPFSKKLPYLKEVFYFTLEHSKTRVLVKCSKKKLIEGGFLHEKNAT